ncbi:sugar diacid utilization regulator [Pseudarthrobacter sp. PvP004]|uniref:helix-turn-helix domain-containing protein n=1 Tax=Micrococcaceae TaxID=1268 RepID=UPI000314D78E|nr:MULTISPECIES: GAF domain-containing protein [Micrococcaceae]MBP2267334.1 sugar diacid utilization regulator [Pseudarthrobacter sp. PvP004]
MKERSDRTVERLQNWLKALAAVGAAVNRGVSLDELLNMVARTSSELMGYDFCSVTVPDQSNSVLLIKGSHGLTDEYIQDVNALHPIRLRGMSLPSPSTQAFTLGIPVSVEDTATNPSFVPWAAAARHQGFTSMIAVPLNAPGGTLGTLNCFTRLPHAFENDEVSLLTVLADQAAVAMNTAQLRADQARTIAEQKSLNESLEKQYELQRKVAEVHNRLTSLTLEGGGIAEVGNALAELLERPVVIQSDQGNAVCGSEYGADDFLDGVAGEAEQVQGESPNSDAISGPSDIRLPLHNGSTVSAVRAPVVIKEEVVAWIWTTGPLTKMAPLHRRAIEHAATVMALEFLYTRSGAASVWYRTGELLSHIIRGPRPSTSVLLAETQRLGYDLLQPHALIAAPHDQVPEDEVLRRLAGKVNRWNHDNVPKPLVGLHKDYVVALWPLGRRPLESVRDIAEQIRQSLTEAETSQLVALTGPVTDPNAYEEAFSIARGAVELARLKGTPSQTLLLTDLGIAGLFLQTQDSAGLRSFCDRILGPLHRYDATNGAALLQTLTVLMNNNLDAQMTAEHLTVNTTTITQRRNLIEQLVGLDLSNVTALTQVSAALQLEEIIAVIPSPGHG